MKFFITGSHGWFGSWITRYMNGIGYEFEVWDRQTFPEGKFNYVIHLAYPCDIEPVLEFTKKNNAVLLYASSGIIYHQDNSHYCNDKLEDEQRIINSGVNYRICRFFSFISESMPDRYLIKQLINAAKNHKPLFVNQKGNAIRSYMYMSDMAQWVFQILLYGGTGIYDVGSNERVSILEIAHAINRLTGNNQILFDDTKPEDPKSPYVPSGIFYENSLELGLKTLTQFEYALKRSINA